MSNLEIKDIFEKERFPKSNWQFISVFFYAPFGLILAVLRFSIGTQAWIAGMLLKGTPAIRSIVLRILCFVLGINVEEDNKGDRSSASKVIVGNCATKIDYIPMYLVTGSVCPSGKKRLFSDLMPGLKDFEGNSTASMKSFVEKGLAPLFLQPEGATSGKNCLLKFTEMPGDLCKEVQPVAIVVERPSWANTAPTVLGSSLPADLFWFLFTPSTLFKVKYLNVIHRNEDESD